MPIKRFLKGNIKENETNVLNNDKITIEAMIENHTLLRYVKKDKIFCDILNHEKCTRELFHQTDKNGYNILMWQIHFINPYLISVVLNHKHCSTELLLQSDSEGNTPLMLACYGQQINALTQIILSPFCTLQVIEHRNKNNQNAVTVAQIADDKIFLDVILSSGKIKQY